MQARATELLTKALGPGAEFRDGQLDALRVIVEQKKRLLLVQRTGWGKSVVYFLAARMLRDEGCGPAILISPLLSLIRDQMRFAERLGVRAARIDSSNRDEWPAVQEAMRRDEVDLLLVSPERLANTSFREEVAPLLQPGIGLFIVDEAHCISDWGHDFRPDYRRIRTLLDDLPAGVPVLATTATANERVVEDIEVQMGEDFVTQRGELARASLRLQAIELRDKAERLAWLAQEVPKLEGSGIVYCITKRDCERVADWLRRHGVAARAYFSGLDDREDLEQALLDNELKVLVSTIALGMGFDKPDLKFVIHYQRPGSPVAYYQQVGRAGRGVPEALGVLLAGVEDEQIHAYFVRTAFPEVAHFRAVLAAVDGAGAGGIGARQLDAACNVPRVLLGKVLNILAVDGAIEKRGRVWTRAAAAWEPDEARWEGIRTRRIEEMEKMRDFVSTGECLMEFIGRELDDPHAERCGRCANCAGPLVSTEPDPELVEKAAAYLRQGDITIEPRKMWPSNSGRPVSGKIPENERAKEGRALSIYGEAGLGRKIQLQREQDGRFDDVVLNAAVECFHRWNPDIDWVACIPSWRRPDLVPEFAERFAAAIGRPFVNVFEIDGEPAPQSEQHNSTYQLRNVFDCLRVDDARVRSGPVLLVDDVVDSRWTLTVAASFLGEIAVFPFTLAAHAG